MTYVVRWCNIEAHKSSLLTNTTVLAIHFWSIWKELQVRLTGLFLWLNELEDNGFTIMSAVVSKENVKEARKLMWDWLEG